MLQAFRRRGGGHGGAARTGAAGILALTIALALALAACGGSGGSSDEAPSGQAASKPVPSGEYVGGVCRTLVRWYEEVGSAFEASEAYPDWDRPASIRAALLVFFDGLQDATESMLVQVEGVGHPDLADGRDLAGDLGDALAAVADRLDANRTAWAAIPLSDVQPAASIEGSMTVVSEQFEAVHLAVAGLDERSPELRRARADDPSCQEFEKQREGNGG